ncbi:phosphoribosylglycinamide formyltransferase [Maribacter sp. 2307UL18-2]|uniref:phosphoribosylglycinamide formyltransferase n=1 Tax=Maribacter sp. 2307UL18-2 TaxID=3386274 RepID=UPI0039BCC32C
MKKIVLFASGSGSNVENIVQFFQGKSNVTIAAVLTNKRDAKVLDRCNNLKINCLYFNRTAFYETDCVLGILESLRPDLIVLAGFLWRIPLDMVQRYPDKIINIHPALLPDYGGKGMYGMRVHEAVKENGETETGITIHFVNENYDEGAIIYQAKTEVVSTDTAEDIAHKVHQLEYEHFPKIIEKLLSARAVH